MIKFALGIVVGVFVAAYYPDEAQMILEGVHTAGDFVVEKYDALTK